MELIMEVKTPPAIKKINSPRNIQVIPLMRRRRFLIWPGGTTIGPPIP
jgi:hypothetical protein